MENQATELPLKVCRHCSVASRTEAAACPSCGKPYQRGFTWRWWMAVPIVALAFAGGFFGLSQIFGDDANVITVEEGDAIQLGVSASELEDELGEASEQVERRKGAEAVSCVYYEIADEPDRTWEYCFARGELVSSQVVRLPADS